MHACHKTQINSHSHSLSNQRGEVTNSISGLIVFVFVIRMKYDRFGAIIMDLMHVFFLGVYIWM